MFARDILNRINYSRKLSVIHLQLSHLDEDILCPIRCSPRQCRAPFDSDYFCKSRKSKMLFLPIVLNDGNMVEEVLVSSKTQVAD